MANVNFGDAARDQLRAMVAAVQLEVTRLPAGDGNHATDELRASWTALVTVLALGAAPDRRECPSCHGIGMRAATRCANCWAKLEPLEPLAPPTPPTPPTTDVARSTP
jgi:hypothetical protein